MHTQNNISANNLQTWPQPDEFAIAQSLRLADLIRYEIDNHGGRISFSRFMELALYEPGLGYYSGGARKFGVDGDFTTAPEISPLFSACLARQCEQVFEETGGKTILELGAGTGIMAVDILSELKRRNNMPDQYLILETSADLRQRQQQLLLEHHPEFYSNIRWLDSLPAQPIEGLILANEVLDALPVHRFKIDNGEVSELMVSGKGDSFSWQIEPAGGELANGVSTSLSALITELPDGYVSEYNLLMPSFIGSLSDALGTGVILVIDYGYPCHEYYHPQRIDGTLLCHYRHRSHSDPFIYVGLQDITASVDFTRVAESADAAGLDVYGFATQSAFLIGCGIDGIMEEHGAGGDRTLMEYSQQAGRLLLPGEMGEKFKVMALGKNVKTSLKGFAFANQLHRL